MWGTVERAFIVDAFCQGVSLKDLEDLFVVGGSGIGGGEDVCSEVWYKRIQSAYGFGWSHLGPIPP